LVAQAIETRAPGCRTELVVVRTEGDRRSGESLDRIGGQGVFTKEIQAAVLDGRADVAVHSAKDLPAQQVGGLILAAVPERADARDALIGCRLADLPAGGSVATGSARRRAQLANIRPDLTFVDLRGNMQRRVDAADGDAVHAVIVAMAALERLGWRERADEILDPIVMLPQAGQGSLAVECRAGDATVAHVLGFLDHPPTHDTLVAERALLAEVGGSCSVPVAAWAEASHGALVLHGLVASGDGRVLVRAHQEGHQPAELGRSLARRLLDDCGGSLIEGWDPRTEDETP